jgi:regulator of cell morphogenesis and NO signaling
MNIQENQNIGELVAQDYRTASVFKKYGIDFCCQGNRTIKNACDTSNVDEQLLVSELNHLVLSKSDKATDFNEWPIDLLTDYIEKKHHRYVEEKAQEIKPYLDKICNVHGDRHEELFEIRNHFVAAADELASHMKKEELILFPYVRNMTKAAQDKTKPETPRFGTVENPIQMMMDEHSTEGERFRKIETLSNNYTPPADACNTYRVTFALLKEFEQDLHLHIHLENNILFPKAMVLENQLLNHEQQAN